MERTRWQDVFRHHFALNCFVLSLIRFFARKFFLFSLSFQIFLNFLIVIKQRRGSHLVSAIHLFMFTTLVNFVLIFYMRVTDSSSSIFGWQSCSEACCIFSTLLKYDSIVEIVNCFQLVTIYTSKLHHMCLAGP